MAPQHRLALTQEATRMPRQRPFAQVDVFARTAYLGNPVAVILDGEDLEDADMQRIARWTNGVKKAHTVTIPISTID